MWQRGSSRISGSRARWFPTPTPAIGSTAQSAISRTARFDASPSGRWRPSRWRRPCSPTCPVSYPNLAPRPRGGALRDARSWAFEPRNRGEHLRLRPSQVLDEVDLRPGQSRHVHRLDVLAAHEKMQRILVLAELVALLDHLLE